MYKIWCIRSVHVHPCAWQALMSLVPLPQPLQRACRLANIKIVATSLSHSTAQLNQQQQCCIQPTVNQGAKLVQRGTC